jgi:hypothetical protein
MARKPQAQNPEEIEANTAKFFDNLEAIRLSPEDTAGLGSVKIITTVPVRKPRKQEFFRCHPDANMTLTAMLITDEEDGAAYFVAPGMRNEGVLANSVKPTLLQLAVLRSGAVFIWPLTLPSVDGGDGRSWHESALKAKEIAKAKWLRIVADRSISGYQAYAVQGELEEPEWEKLLAGKTFNELLELAFADKIILSEDQPMVRKLRGLV